VVWNGKTGEVCNIVLPLQMIEQKDGPRPGKPIETTQSHSIFSISGDD